MWKPLIYAYIYHIKFCAFYWMNIIKQGDEYRGGLQDFDSGSNINYSFSNFSFKVICSCLSRRIVLVVLNWKLMSPLIYEVHQIRSSFCNPTNCFFLWFLSEPVPTSINQLWFAHKRLERRSTNNSKCITG